VFGVLICWTPFSIQKADDAKAKKDIKGKLSVYMDQAEKIKALIDLEDPGRRRSSSSRRST
jgi:hypothetical protein